MSRQPSPGPSLPRMQFTDPNAHLPQHLRRTDVYPGAYPGPDPGYAHKQRQKYAQGITAGVEDVKYQQKYKELRKKVKEIEQDNDRLYFKLLLAKKNIRRMNLERAILYERLAAVPPTPGRQTQELPPETDSLFQPQPPAPPEHARAIDPHDPAVMDYMRAHPNARLVQGQDGRIVAVEDTPAIGPGGNPVMSAAPPHGLPLVSGFRHDSGPGYDPNRQLPPLPPMIPVIHPSQEPPRELPPMNDHHPGHAYPHAQPHAVPHAHSTSTSHHSRGSSARPDLDIVPGAPQRVDSLPSVHSVRSRSPDISADVPNERSRRHEVRELPPAHAYGLPHQHVQVPPQNMPASPTSPSSPTHPHPRTGRHNHQRVGPGAQIHRERDPEEQAELERERERERVRELEREQAMRIRLAREEQEDAALFATREDPGLVGPGVSRRHSGSDSPRSAVGSRVPSRPGSVQSVQSYERERSRAYAPHVSNLLGIDEEPGAAARAASGADSAGAQMDTRKRSRGEMEDSDEARGEVRPPSAAHSSAGSASDRGPKRLHRDEDDGSPEDDDEQMGDA